MRSSAGVGTTPPKVLGSPKPWSSVMMSRMLGAPVGGTIRGAHQGVDFRAFRSISPPKGGAGGGSWSPGMEVVALGDPSLPVTCWALVGRAVSEKRPAVNKINEDGFMSEGRCE